MNWLVLFKSILKSIVVIVVTITTVISLKYIVDYIFSEISIGTISIVFFGGMLVILTYFSYGQDIERHRIKKKDKEKFGIDN